MAGSVRGDAVLARVEELWELARELGLEEGEGKEVELVVNAEWGTVKEWMGVLWGCIRWWMSILALGWSHFKSSFSSFLICVSARLPPLPPLYHSPSSHYRRSPPSLQAAGLIPLDHASAGPLLDILVPYPPPQPLSPFSSLSSALAPSLPTGFLASRGSSESPAHASASQLLHILTLSPTEQDSIRDRARRNATERFSVEYSETGWRVAWR